MKEREMQDRDTSVQAPEPVELGEDELAIVAGGLKAMWMDEEGD